MLDGKDRKILYALELDGRASYAKLGRKARMPPEVVAYRMERLVKRGVVRGFYSMIDSTKLGYITYRLYLRLQDATPERERELYDYLTAHPKTFWVFSAYGLPDVALALWVRDIYEFHDFLREFKTRFRSILREVLITQFVRIYQYPRSYLLPKPIRRKPHVIGGREKVEVDEIDWRILRFLGGNARAPLLEVARVAGISPAAASYRIRRLRKKRVILGFRPLIDHRKLGLLWCKIFLSLREPKIAARIDAFCDIHPSVSYRYESVGPWDMEIEVEVPGFDALNEFLQELKARFGESIRSLDQFIHYREYKSNFVPMG